MPHFYPDDHFALPAQEYLEIVLEQSKKQLIKMRVQLREKPEELEVKERNFLRRECARLNSLSKLQARLEKYRLYHQSSRLSDKVKEARKFTNSEKLSKHLRASGHFKPGVNWQAHHIICSKHLSHASARLKLFAYLGINDPSNGCWLPIKQADAIDSIYPDAAGHVYVHTEAYSTWVSNKVKAIQGAGEMHNVLRNIRLKLLRARKEQEVFSLLSKDGQLDLKGVIKSKSV